MKSSGHGDANDATVETAPDDGYSADLEAEAKARVAGAEARVEKLKAHLAGAEDALAEAKAAVKEL